MKQPIEKIAQEDGRYHYKGLKFIFDGLSDTIDRIRKQENLTDQPRHVTGQELAWGLAELAKKRWGRLATMVLAQWGIHSTRDFGEIVYLMIQNEWMTCQDTDRKEDFDDVFDFTEVFENNFNFENN